MSATYCRAGALLAVLNATQIAAGLAVAWLADRMWSRRTWMTGGAGLGLVSMLGVVLPPDAGLLWAFLLGATMGPLFSLTMALPLAAGYTLSALSPFVLGAVRDASSSYDVVLSQPRVTDRRRR